MDNVQKMIAIIWYIVRDYAPRIYSKKQVCAIVAEKLATVGYTVSIEKNGRIIVDNVPYLIYKEKGWNSFDVRHTII